MAAAVAKKEPRIRNVVHDDAIWRQTVRYEQITAKNWQPYWGFMTEALDDKQTTPKNVNSRHQRLPPIPPHHPQSNLSSGLPSKLPPGITLPSDNGILSDWLISYRTPSIIRVRKPYEKYSAPCTTSSEIGWLWGTSRVPAVSVEGLDDRPVKFHTLERFPREAHGRGDVMKWWGGGRESLP